ncbi:unnamed protein product [Spirodela intermedia]|uniref:Uncharacterized protein n=1 Tax=Spirodela intermedia TaxID=51605 RepID=A0A7I8ILH8_SPIIN|nr:unnamed protein product [Spirodela intermedia]CAA6658804.1 unnamed protein product [Spirodela intermedia]
MIGQGVIGKLGAWYDQIPKSNILLYLLSECIHSTLSDDFPYIALEGWPIKLNVAKVRAIYVQQVDSLAEGVCHHVLLILLVAKDKGEVLQSTKLLIKEIMVLVFESLNDDVELTIVSGVSKPHVIQLLTEVLYGMTFLAKDTPNTDARGITSDLKYLAKVRDGCWTTKLTSPLDEVLVNETAREATLAVGIVAS